MKYRAEERKGIDMKSGAVKRRVTLQDIAQATGYTVNTVSRALKNKSDISHVTCERIQQVADEMGYVRNYMASSLRSGRSRTIAVIVGGMSNPFYSVMVDVLYDIAAELGYMVLVMCSRDHAEQERQAIITAIGRQVDGLILCPCEDSNQNVELLKASGIPYVLASRPIDGLDADCVRCDEENGAYLATRHLIEAGHRKLAYLYSYDVQFSTKQRMRGFLRAGREMDIPEGNMNTFFSNANQLEIANQLRKWQRDGVTGLFVFCDMEAWNVISQIEACGYSVPENFGIVGFDGIESFLHFPKQLCTIDGAMAEIGRSAMKLLYRRMRGEEFPSQNVIFPVKLVCNGTCKQGRMKSAGD